MCDNILDKINNIEYELNVLKQYLQVVSDTLNYNEDNGTDAVHLSPLAKIICNNADKISEDFDELQFIVIRIIQTKKP